MNITSTPSSTETSTPSSTETSTPSSTETSTPSSTKTSTPCSTETLKPDQTTLKVSSRRKPIATTPENVTITNKVEITEENNNLNNSIIIVLAVIGGLMLLTGFAYVFIHYFRHNQERRELTPSLLTI